MEGFRRVLAEHAVGAWISEVTVRDTGVLHGTTARGLHDALAGRSFAVPARHGKWLLAPTDGPILLLHFGMTGELHWCAAAEPYHRHDRVIFATDRGDVRYRDMRKLTGLWLAPDSAAADRLLAGTGPDALAVSKQEFIARLTARRRVLKGVLLDQRVIAGMGNLVADEVLWWARLRPDRTTAELDEGALAALHAALRQVLRTGVRAGRVPPRKDWLTGHRDAGAACPRCGHPLRVSKVSGRSTVWCPHCQR